MNNNNSGFQGDGRFWIGQVAPNQIENELASNGFGFRVRVRIQGVHSLTAEIRNEDLPLAIVKMPTTHGNGNRLASGLVGGEFVTGYFLDDKRQIPVIDGVLARSTNEKDIQASTAMSSGTTFGRPVAPQSQTRFNSRSHQRISGTAPNGPAKPSAADFGKKPGIMENGPTKSESGIPKEPTIIKNSDGTTTVQFTERVDGEIVKSSVKLQPGSEVTPGLLSRQESQFNREMANEALRRGDYAAQSFYSSKF